MTVAPRRAAVALLVLLVLGGAAARAEHSYLVRPGDTLYALAGRFGTTVASLKSVNRMTSDTLRVGQVLTVPGVAPGGYRTVFAAPGETLASLAQRTGRSQASLRSANPGLTTDSVPAGAAISVPPADGVTVFAEAGDTVRALAARAGVPASRVAEANAVSENATLPAGRPVLVPASTAGNAAPAVAPAAVGGLSLPTAPASPIPAPPTGRLGATLADVGARAHLKELQNVALHAAIARLPAVSFRSPTFEAPLHGRITSRFGWRALSVNGNHFHAGVDLAAPMGTPVHAARDGTVAKAGWGGTYGNVVFLDHGDGTQTRYAHMSRIEVRVGQRVRQGDVLGLVGSTGASTGPHVHFELRFDGRAVDPLAYLEGVAAP